jgi:hypothetical protein
MHQQARLEPVLQDRIGFGLKDSLTNSPPAETNVTE